MPTKVITFNNTKLIDCYPSIIYDKGGIVNSISPFKIKTKIIMTKEFIRIGKKRIRISTIKRYEPNETTKIVIRFSTNPNNTASETFDLLSEDVRDEVIHNLDRGHCIN
jgi:hypothetical protein